MRSQIKKIALTGITFTFVLFVAAAANARASTVTIDATSNIFGAGHSVPPDPGGGGGGSLPPSVRFSSGPDSILTFASVVGTVSFGDGSSLGPDGLSGYSTNISSFGGISGIVYNNSVFFLVGVFLNNSEPMDPAPSRLSFSGPQNFTNLFPELNQTFFIGDGLTATGDITQNFHVPSGATRLFLGFEDARGFNSAPGYYGDNSGFLSATFSISSVPEPSGCILLTIGLFASAGCHSARSARRVRHVRSDPFA